MEPPPEPIVCRVTGWFYRRTVLPGLICAGVAAWFFYDATSVYPAKVRAYQEYRAYTIQRSLLVLDPADPELARAKKDWQNAVKIYPDFRLEMRWADLAKRYGWPDGNPPPEWPDYARSNGYREQWPQKERLIPSKITEQYVAGVIFVIAASTFLLNALMGRKLELRADADGISFPSGERVPYNRILRVDNRKWRDQGISRIVWTKPGGEKAVIRLDCLKFEEDGAERIMQRILAVPGIEVVSAA